jgi:hypothetical protein
MTESECRNFNSVEQCDSCLFERVICLQEGECLLHKQICIKESCYESKSEK